MRGKIITILCIAAVIAVGDLVLHQWHRNRDLESQVRDLQVQLAHAQVPLKPDTIHDSIPVVTQRAVS